MTPDHAPPRWRVVNGERRKLFRIRSADATEGGAGGADPSIMNRGASL